MHAKRSYSSILSSSVQKKFDFVFVAWKSLHKKLTTNSNWQIVLLMLFAFIWLSWPIWHSQMYLIHDYTHAVRIAEMTRALTDGHFPVRWSKYLGFGYGMPLFEFYAPLPFYVGAVIYWLSGQLLLAVKSLFLISNLLTLLGAWLLGRKLFRSRLAAVAVSLAVGFAPYRLLNLYIRGAVNELWGIMALPWILWATIKLIRGDKNGLVLTAISLSVLFTSHNITTLIFAPFFILFSLGMIAIFRDQKKATLKSNLKVLSRLVMAGLLAIGISSFYLFPAYFEKSYTQVEKFILADYFNFRIHFLYIRQFFTPHWGYGGSEWGPDDPISFFLGFGQVITLILAAAIGITTLLSRKNHKKVTPRVGIPILSGILLFGSSYFTLLKSQWLWEKISILAFVQFPWRFLSLSLVFVALLSGWVTDQLLLLNTKKLNKIFLMSLMIGLLLLNGIFARPEGYLDQASSLYSADPTFISTQMSSILPDYLPKEMIAETPASKVVSNIDQFSRGELYVVINRTHELLLSTDFQKPTEVVLNIADYPGWQAYLNNERISHEHDSDGKVVVKVPEKDHHLSLRFEPTPLRLISDLLSLGSIWLTLLLLWTKRTLA